MKKQAFLLITAGSLWLITMIIFAVIGNYQFERDYLSYWNLAEKASTIQQKALYMDKFASSLKGKGLEGDYNALFLKTLDNSFDKNYEALQSLTTRLDEIQKMNIASFEYQTAIQQITAQEQGEAQSMLSDLFGIWWKHHYFLLWSWVAFIMVLIGLFLLGAGLVKLGGGWKKIGDAMRESARQNRMNRLS